MGQTRGTRQRTNSHRTCDGSLCCGFLQIHCIDPFQMMAIMSEIFAVRDDAAKTWLTPRPTQWLPGSSEARNHFRRQFLGFSNARGGDSLRARIK